MDYVFTGVEGVQAQPEVDEFLRAANFHFTRLPHNRAVRARVAMFPTLMYVHATVPETSIVWPRDQLSMDRSLLLMVLKGDVEVASESVVFERDLPEGRIYLVPPGETTVQFTVRSLECELFYISIDTAVVTGASAQFGNTPDPQQVDALILNPLLAFSTRLCALPAGLTSDLAPLQGAAESIARTFASLVSRPGFEHEPIYERAVRLIQASYSRAEFSPTRIAAELNVSVRTLQLAFAAHGVTPARALRDERAHAALELKQAEPTLPSREVARRTGFGSVKTLRRALATLDDA